MSPLLSIQRLLLSFAFSAFAVVGVAVFEAKPECAALSVVNDLQASFDQSTTQASFDPPTTQASGSTDDRLALEDDDGSDDELVAASPTTSLPAPAATGFVRSAVARISSHERRLTLERPPRV